MASSRGLKLEDLRRFAIVRNFVPAPSLGRAIARMGFVQADPIRAPARAQDLTLRHRVPGYRAGDLERRYEKLPVEEEHFINYGFMPRSQVEWLHPRTPRRVWDRRTKKLAQRVLELVTELGQAHPREIDAHFRLGSVVNYWGGSSSATTHLLDGMHYRGMLRVVRREGGIRIYAPRTELPRARTAPERRRAAERLLALAVDLYAPLPARSLGELASRLRHAAPQLAHELTDAQRRARQALARERIGESDWFWPATQEPRALDGDLERVRFLAPFDPLVWDRRRFEAFWGWAYRFEAYTPVSKRKLGYYALPLSWRDAVIGWGNFTWRESKLDVQIGYVSGRPPRERAFARELDAELERMAAFLGVNTCSRTPPARGAR